MLGDNWFRRLKAPFLVAGTPICFMAAVLVSPPAYDTGDERMPPLAPALQGECGLSQVEVVGGQPSPFLLPRDSGQTLSIDPDATLHIAVRNPPANGSVQVKLAGLLGGALQATYPIRGVGPVVTVHSVSIADYVRWGRGIYSVEGVLFDSVGDPICRVPFQVRIQGFGGAAGVASAAAAGVAGAGALLNVLGNLKLNLQSRIKVSIGLERRRRRGLRRWMPFPSWKRILTGSVLGTVSGVAIVVLLQQGGITPISLGSALTGLVVGGLAPVGVSVALGSIIGFLRPLKDEAPEHRG